MHELLLWLESSALGQQMRQAGVWSYAIVNLVHLSGVAILFGAVLLLDLRLLGAWRTIPLRSVSVPAERLARVGFPIAAASGVCLLVTNATEYLDNPFFLIKFPMIALALLNVALIDRLPAWRAHRTRDLEVSETRGLAVAGAVSLVCWSAALVCGRMIGYW